MKEASEQVNVARLTHNLDSVKGRIADACTRAGRDRESVRLLAVTKNVSADMVAALQGLGVTHFGESRVPDALSKVERFSDCRWDFIGRLQTNKVNKVVGRFERIHSVASLDLAAAIDRRAAALGLTQQVLLQVNVTGEAAKQGFAPEAVAEAVRAVKAHAAIQLDGLMTMAPYGASPEACGEYFATLRRIAEDVSSAESVALEQLSMGMSDDFEPAVENGATIVRIGSALFEGM